MEVTRTLPVNFKEADQLLFEHELVRNIPDPVIDSFKSVLLDSNGTFITSKKLPDRLTEKSSIYSISRMKWNYLLLKKLLNFSFRMHWKPVVWFTDDWSHGYFHWMLDALPRLFHALNSYPGAEVLIPASFKSIGFIEESIRTLGPGKVSFMKPGRFYFFRKLVFPPHLAPTGNYYEPVIRQLQDIYIEGKNSRDLVKRIYISRQNAGRRKLINENELTEVLKSYDFEFVNAEDLTWNQQRILFSGCRILVGIHGAGLSNMIFMQPGSTVIEIRRKGDRHNNCYFSLSSALKHNYYYCDATSVDDREDTLTADLNVQLDNISDILKSITHYL